MSDVAAVVRELLSRGEPESRRLGAQQLGKLRGPAAAELLVRALGDTDWRVRKEAAAVAPALESRNEAVAALVGALAEKTNVGLRNAAVEALVAIGPEVVPKVVDALRALDGDGRKLAVEILGGVPDARGSRALAKALSDPDSNVVAAAAEALGNASLAGEEARALAISALTGVLGSSGTLVKLAALESLSRLDAKVEWSTYRGLASDPLLKRQAISAAARSHEKEAVRALAGAIGDRSPAVSSDALVALVEYVLLDPREGGFAEVAREAVRALPAAASRIRELARSDESRIRGAALVGLGLLREPGDVATLAEGLVDEEVSSRAEAGLRLYGTDAVAPLMEAGRKSEPPMRATAIALVPALSPARDARTQKALHEALQDPSADVVAAALKVIAITGTAGDLEVVARYALADDARVAASARSAVHSLASRHVGPARALLARIHPDGADAVVGCIVLAAMAEAVTVPPSEDAVIGDADIQFLGAAVAQGDPNARRAALDALSAIGGDSAADAVALAVTDEEREVRLVAIRALGRMARVEPLVTLVESSHDPEVAAAALRALCEASPERAFAVARPRVRADSPGVACAAVEAIGAMRGPRRDDALFEALEHHDTEVVKTALFSLGRGLDARAIARLGLCLDHDSWEVRRLAAELLGQEATRPARALLRARLERETDVAVREAIAASLSARTPDVEAG